MGQWKVDQHRCNEVKDWENMENRGEKISKEISPNLWKVLMFINAYTRSFMYFKLDKIKSSISISESNFARLRYILKAAQERIPSMWGKKNKTYGWLLIIQKCRQEDHIFKVLKIYLY